jgi:hypothetical protein
MACLLVLFTFEQSLKAEGKDHAVIRMGGKYLMKRQKGRSSQQDHARYDGGGGTAKRPG